MSMSEVPFGAMALLVGRHECIRPVKTVLKGSFGGPGPTEGILEKKAA